MPAIISVHITTSNSTEANRLARALVEEKLAACVNLVPAVQSIYRWEGEIKEADEVLLIVKTRAEQFEALRKFVTTHHTYKVPMVIAFQATAGHQPYLDWIAQETAR